MSNDLIKSKQELKERLDTVILPEEEVEEIITDKTGKALFTGILESIGLGGVVKVCEIAENVNEEIAQRKQALLLSNYFSNVDDLEEEINKLKSFVSDPVGNTLFNKVVRIVNANPPTKAYVELLAKVLAKLTNSDFQKLFSQHIYALSQIEKLTPQSLILLADYGSWPEYYIDEEYESDHGVITTEWIGTFVLLYYAPLKRIDDDSMIQRIVHSFRELQRNDFVISRLQNETDSKTISSIKESTKNPAICDLTELGKEIIDYLD